VRWVVGESVDDVPALLPFGREEGADEGEVHCTFSLVRSAAPVTPRTERENAALARAVVKGTVAS
jgi:hypothetical protein